MTGGKKTEVLILYNFTGEDEYERMKTVDPESLSFHPVYDIDVGTVMEEYRAIEAALMAEGYAAKLFNIEENLGRLTGELDARRPDVIFNLVEHFRDNPQLEASVAGLFELYGIPYTGSSPFALTLCQRKGFTKQILDGHGIGTPRFRILHAPKIPKRHGLKYPLIAKPAREDASTGVSKASVVYDYASLAKLIDSLYGEFRQAILVEEFIEGRELHVSVFGNDAPTVFPPIEFDFSELDKEHPHLITYEIKWSPLDPDYHKVHTICPAPLAARELRRLERASLEAYRVTGCRDYARLDIRMNKKGEVFILEVNPNPDLTEGVSFMETAEKAGMGFSTTLAQIVQFALARRKAPPEATTEAAQ